MKTSKRFVIMTDTRKFYVYASDEKRATEIFAQSDVGRSFDEWDCSLDVGDWKTTLQEGLTKSGATVSGH